MRGNKYLVTLRRTLWGTGYGIVSSIQIEVSANGREQAFRNAEKRLGAPWVAVLCDKVDDSANEIQVRD